MTGPADLGSPDRSFLGGIMRRLFAAIDRAVEVFVAAIFGGMVLVGFFQVFSRFMLNKTPSWSEEIQIFGHIWLVFLAIPIAYRRGAHFTVEAVRRQYSLGMHKVFDLMVEFLWAGFAVVTAWYSYRVSLVAGRSVSPGLEIPMSYPYYGMIIGSLYLLLVVTRRLAGEPPPEPAPQPPAEPAAETAP
jgi:TRAP-type C4-dicarboxylate transport system permease small subunit